MLIIIRQPESRAYLPGHYYYLNRIYLFKPPPTLKNVVCCSWLACAYILKLAAWQACASLDRAVPTLHTYLLTCTYLTNHIISYHIISCKLENSKVLIRWFILQVPVPVPVVIPNDT